MFPDLPALTSDALALEEAGGPGGICDPRATGMVSPSRDDDGAEAAGWPFFGQLIAHDITADRSPVGPESDVQTLRNARSPRLDLEMVYADGPVGSPYLYDVRDPAKLLLGEGDRDLPRNSQGVALIGDPRNDVHLFVARLHLVLLQAHNGLVDRLRVDGTTEGRLLNDARRALTWHYQWIVLHDFLPRLVGEDIVTRIIADGGHHFAPPPGDAFIPLEFADAAYRYGHGQIRHTYQLRGGGLAMPLFPDLVGFGPIAAEHELDLAMIFDLPGSSPAQRAKRIDGTLPTSLIELPHQITGDVTDAAYRSLAVRDLLRGAATRLPSGEAIAEALGVATVRDQELARTWPGGTPLWLYVLKEAELLAAGDGLGPVGGQIVAEVLIGLLRADPGAYLYADPNWSPTLPAGGPTFGFADLLTFVSR
jgi:hypothetical protein